MKPKIYIAAPFFNLPQNQIVVAIESALDSNSFPYYSPRIHSGSAYMTPEQRKDPKAWEPVFKSNTDELDRCDLMIAVIEYAMPDTQSVTLNTWEIGQGGGNPVKLEVPDSGVVWEMGAFHHMGKPIVAFHSSGAKKLNLMLSHSCNGFIRGFDQLKQFLTCPYSTDPGSALISAHFNWDSVLQSHEDEVE